MVDQLSTVLETTSMTAAEMTHSLCKLGNGSMGDGILYVFEDGIQLGILEGFLIGWEKGWKSGRTKGLLTGAAIVASGAAIVGLCIWGARKHKAKNCIRKTRLLHRHTTMKRTNWRKNTMRKHKVAGIIAIFLVISLLFSGCTGVIATSIFQTRAAAIEMLPLGLESVEFIHLLGMGAWATNLILSRDGSFHGHYHDTDMGLTGNGYPNGTEYTYDFSGCFQDIRKINDYTYAMTLASMEVDTQGTQWIEDGVLHITEEPAGMSGGKTFLLYMPDAPLDQLPKDLLFWWKLRYWDEDGTNRLNVFALYNEETHCGFFPTT